jgi:hypothetical protein
MASCWSPGARTAALGIRVAANGVPATALLCLVALLAAHPTTSSSSSRKHLEEAGPYNIRPAGTWAPGPTGHAEACPCSPEACPCSQPPRRRPTALARQLVVVWNSPAFHLEILLGVVATVLELDYDVAVYRYKASKHVGSRERLDAAMSLLQQRYGSFPDLGCDDLELPSAQKNNAASGAPPLLRRAAVVIFVSGQEEVMRSKSRALFHAALGRFRPRTIMPIIHNTARRHLTAELAGSHASVCMVPLSLRNEHSMAASLAPPAGNTRVSWMLPIHALGGGDLCVHAAAPCRTHFTIQGNMDSSRRDYRRVIWEMQHRQQLLAAAGIRLQLVGAGAERPAVPAALQANVDFHRYLGFTEFYDVVMHSVALIPALASDAYTNGSKITSTVVTSLISGVPILADAALMHAYSFLPPSCFYHQWCNESVADGMLRVAAMSAEEHSNVRRSLMAARVKLQGHNMQALQNEIERGMRVQPALTQPGERAEEYLS